MLDEIAQTITESFVDANFADVRNDCIDFFNELEKDGFIVSAETEQELEEKDRGFSYARLSGV